MSGFYRPPNVLFLRGLTEKDLDDDDTMFDTKFLAEVDSFAIEPVIVENSFDELPRYFTNSVEWPITTNLWCRNCSRQYKSRPVPVPGAVSFDEDGQRKIDVVAVCCSSPCAQSHINLYYTGQAHDDKSRLLRVVHEELFDLDLIIIPPSPNPGIMKRYIGIQGLSEEEFEKRITSLIKGNTLSQYKVEHHNEI